jgi:isochorismate hydrolase
VIEGNPALLVLDGANAYRPFASLLNAIRGWSMPVIFAAADSQTFAVGVSAAHAGEQWIRPPCLSAFLGTPLSLLLSQLNVQTLLLAGGRTSVEVHYSFVDAHQNDYFCRLAEDCMTGVSPAAHEAALKAMEYLQTDARQSSTRLLAALQAAQARRSST